jgi:hypothetical protein
MNINKIRAHAAVLPNVSVIRWRPASGAASEETLERFSKLV